MSLARVVAFDGVTKERMEEVRRQIGEQGRPDEIPATEIMILHDLTRRNRSPSCSSPTRRATGMATPP